MYLTKSVYQTWTTSKFEIKLNTVFSIENFLILKVCTSLQQCFPNSVTIILLCHSVKFCNSFSTVMHCSVSTSHNFCTETTAVCLV